jgi:predicted transcriptional regulator
MERQTVSFVLDSDKVSALDDLAARLGRNRSFLLNEAITAYLDVQQWQIQHIEKAIKQADSGKFVEHRQVRKAANSWSRGR